MNFEEFFREVCKFTHFECARARALCFIFFASFCWCSHWKALKSDLSFLLLLWNVHSKLNESPQREEKKKKSFQIELNSNTTFNLLHYRWQAWLEAIKFFFVFRLLFEWFSFFFPIKQSLYGFFHNKMLCFKWNKFNNEKNKEDLIDCPREWKKVIRFETKSTFLCIVFSLYST